MDDPNAMADQSCVMLTNVVWKSVATIDALILYRIYEPSRASRNLNSIGMTLAQIGADVDAMDAIGAQIQDPTYAVARGARHVEAQLLRVPRASDRVACRTYEPSRTPRPRTVMSWASTWSCWRPSSAVSQRAPDYPRMKPHLQAIAAGFGKGILESLERTCKPYMSRFDGEYSIKKMTPELQHQCSPTDTSNDMNERPHVRTA